MTNIYLFLISLRDFIVNFFNTMVFVRIVKPRIYSKFKKGEYSFFEASCTLIYKNPWFTLFQKYGASATSTQKEMLKMIELALLNYDKLDSSDREQFFNVIANYAKDLKNIVRKEELIYAGAGVATSALAGMIFESAQILSLEYIVTLLKEKMHEPNN